MLAKRVLIAFFLFAMTLAAISGSAPRLPISITLLRLRLKITSRFYAGWDPDGHKL